MNDKLKPCPFCGGDAGLVRIECKSCYSRTDLYSNTKSAVEAWNNRTSTWKPIETAPKDGTAILTWKHGWREVEKCICRDGKFHVVNVFDEKLGEVYPTHWMPLPEHPEDEK